MFSQKIIDWLSAVEPTERRLYAARLLNCSGIGWIISHILLVVFKESSIFNHIVMGISWFAIGATCIDIILTTDVRACKDDESGS